MKEYFLHPSPGTKGKTYTFAAGVLDDLWGFDPAVFGISPREAGQMDPQQRLMLQVAWEALEDAGLPPDSLRGKQVGVYVGCSAMAHASRLSQDAAITDAYLMTGNTLALVSNRISHVLDLRGPSMTVDTACSSSLVALRLAQDALMAGLVDVAVVGGVNALLDPFHYVGFSSARMLSPKGRCQPFSARADGYVRAEGAVAFVLERCEARQLSPRRAYARLRAVETNTDGWTVNVALPSVEGQSALLRQVYGRAEVDPDSLLFVEAHGTGTLAGDPVEAQALGSVLGQARRLPLPIGSVKSNIGHLEPASGAAGLLKALVALEAGVFPATLHLDEVNPAIPFDALNLAVSGEAVRLPMDGIARFAGVSSFGFGGANAHAILERLDAPDPIARKAVPPATAPVLVLSAFAEKSLLGAARAWADLAGQAGSAAEVADLAAQAAAFRGRHPMRMGVICGTPDETQAALDRAAAGLPDPRVERADSRLREAPVAFVYSGNGSQYAGMGLEFLKADAAYARAMRRIDRHFRRLSGWSILARLEASDLEAALGDASIAQPLLFADQMALTEALKARGLGPDAVMGHSGGEVAAACAAGALSLEQGLEVILHRSLQAATMRGEGAMGAVQASAAEVRAALADAGPSLAIAAVNSPKSVTIVGHAGEVEAFLRHARRALRWPAVRLGIDYPYHSRAMERLRAPLMHRFAALRPQAGRVPFVSSVTGDIRSGEDLDATYWCENFCQPVNFEGAMQKLEELGFRAFLEIGSQPVLQGYMAACLADPEAVFLPTGEVTAGRDGLNPVDRVMARAMVRGVRIVPRTAVAKPGRMRPDLPKYVWANEEIRIDRTSGILNRLGDSRTVNPILGREEGLEAGVWRSEMDPFMLPKLTDHRIGGKVIVPATAVWEILLAAVAARDGQRDALSLVDVEILSPIVLSKQAITEVQTRFDRAQGFVSLGIRSRGQEGEMRSVAKARLYAGPRWEEPVPVPDPLVRDGDRDGAEIYASVRRRGIDYGPQFARVRRFRLQGDAGAEVFLDEAENLFRPEAPFVLDVIGADAALHGLVGLLEHTRLGGTGLGFLPQRLERLDVIRQGGKVATARLNLRRIGVRSLLADVLLFDREGQLLVRLSGLRLNAVRLVRDVDLGQHGFHQTALRVAPRREMTFDLAQAVMDAAESDGMHPLDDGALLIEAVTHVVAAEALARVAGPGLDLPCGEGVHPYLRSLAGMALRSGHGDLRGAMLCIRPPEPGEAERLLDLVAKALPDRVADWMALIHLRTCLPDILTRVLEGEDPPLPEAVFGRDLLAGLSPRVIFEARVATAVDRALRQVVASVDGSAALRIAELSDGRFPVTTALLRRLPENGACLTAVRIAAKGADASDPALPEDRVVLIDADGAAMASAGPFDIILSVGAFGAVEDAPALAALARGALAPGGRLLAVELPPSDFADLVQGLDPGWGKGGAAGASTGRLSGSALQEIARRAGFATAEVRTMPDGCAGAGLVVARSEEGPEDGRAEPADPVLIEALRDGFGDCTEDRIIPLPPGPGGGKRIVALFPCHDGDAVAVLGRRILSLRDMLRDAPEGARVICVIPGGSGMAGQKHPVQAGLWTFLRSVANEFPLLRVLRHDLAEGLRTEVAARRIADWEMQKPEETEVLHDLHGSDVLRVLQGVGGASVSGAGSEEERRILRAPVAGGLDDLAWGVAPRRAPGAGEVEIAVEAAGLNYRDVMWAMGLLPEEALEKGFAGPNIGIECAGTILRCGPGCGDHRPGDRVVTFGPGCMASHLTVQADLVARLPDGMSAEAGATLPVAFFTAWYSLVSLAGLRAGEWVLIHGGAGGVGLAAIQIARAQGAKIIATAGSAAKRSLLRAAGVEHVLDSRTLAFAEEVRRLTDGHGVDVVLNSLAGAAMERSLACLAPFGRFIELGKQDFYSNTTLGLRALRENLSYHAVDVDQLMSERPQEAKSIFAQMMEGFQTGRFSALPHRCFDGVEAVAAFRLMQKSGHVGKIVLRPQLVGEGGAGVAEAQVGDFVPSRDRFYLIVGGLGGLGLEVADFLVEAGARRIALMGRRTQPDAAAAALIDRWRRKGCDVRLVACDVADADTLEQVLPDVRPLAGVIHSAMVLEDMPLAQVTDEVLQRVLPAKITGATNLDRLTRQDDLEVFVLFTSMATLIGNHGQSAYVAANGFLEGLARARRAAGLPAIAVGWGAIGDVGYLARDLGRAAMVRRMSGNVDFTGLQATRALDRLLAAGKTAEPVVHVSPMAWQAVAATLPTLSEPAFGLFRRLGRRDVGESEEEDLRAALMGMPQDRAVARMVAWLSGRIARILQVSEKAVHPGKPVSELGIDSLMGVELGLTLQDALGADIPTTAVSDSFSIDEISLRIVRHIHGPEAGEPAAEAQVLRTALQHLAVAEEGRDQGGSAPSEAAE